MQVLTHRKRIMCRHAAATYLHESLLMLFVLCCCHLLCRSAECLEKEIDESPIGPVYLGELVGLIESGEIGGKIAKDVFADMLESGESPSEIVEKKGLKQVSDPAAIAAMIDDIIAKNAQQVEKYKGGNQNPR